MAARLDIYVARNEHWGRSVRLLNADRTPIDLTGCTIQMQIKSRTDNAAIVATGECIIDRAETGEFTIRLNAAEGSALGEYGDQLQTANLPYDVRLVDGDGFKLDLLSGVVILNRGVTRNG